jgi:hypothetical protein
LAEISNTSQDSEDSQPQQPSRNSRASMTSQVSQGSQNSQAIQSSLGAPFSRVVDAFSDTDNEPGIPSPTSPRSVSTGSWSTESGTASSVRDKGGILGKVLPFPFCRTSSETPMKFARVATPKFKPRTVFQSYCFSTDGKTLILWPVVETELQQFPRYL